MTRVQPGDLRLQLLAGHPLGGAQGGGDFVGTDLEHAFQFGGQILLHLATLRGFGRHCPWKLALRRGSSSPIPGPSE